jgi:hypothetical protein
MNSSKLWVGGLCLALALAWMPEQNALGGGEMPANGKRYSEERTQVKSSSRTSTNKRSVARARTSQSADTYTASYDTTLQQPPSSYTPRPTDTVCVPRPNRTSVAEPTVCTPAATYAHESALPTLRVPAVARVASSGVQPEVPSSRMARPEPRRFFTGTYTSTLGQPPGDVLSGYETWTGNHFGVPVATAPVYGINIGRGPTRGVAQGAMAPPPGRAWTTPATVVNQTAPAPLGEVVAGPTYAVAPQTAGGGYYTGAYTNGGYGYGYGGAYTANYTTRNLPRTETMGMAFDDQSGRSYSIRTSPLGAGARGRRITGPMSNTYDSSGGLRDFY